jgi:hypothetical protein
MADIDTSFYPRANQNSILDTLSQVQALKNAGVQNQLLQTEAQRAGVGLSQDKINLAHQQFGQLSSFLGSLAQDPRISTDAGPGLLKQATAQAVQQGWITPDIANSEIANMPTDPAQIPQYLQSLNTRIQDAAGQFSKIYGEPTTINNGNSIVPVTASPLTGIRRIGADIPVQTSPSERLSLVPGTNAQGQPTVTPAGVIAQQAGMNPLTGVPATAPNQPVNQLQPYPQGQAPVPAAQAPATGSSVVTGPSPGALEANKTVGAASGQQLAADTAQEANFQADIVPLQKARDALISLGTTGTGPGTEQINEIKSFAQSMGLGTLAGIDPDKIKNFDEAKKYLTQYASQAGSPNTNDKLAAAFAGNPSVGISNAASVDVLKTAMSLRRMQNAKVRAFQASGEQPATYNQWAAKFNSSQDPVAYGFDMMSPEQRKKYVGGLSQAERQKFVGSLQTATQLGLVTPPQQSAAPANGG